MFLAHKKFSGRKAAIAGFVTRTIGLILFKMKAQKYWLAKDSFEETKELCVRQKTYPLGKGDPGTMRRNMLLSAAEAMRDKKLAFRAEVTASYTSRPAAESGPGHLQYGSCLV